MAEENQLAGNLLQTQEEADRKAAAMGQQEPQNTQPVYNPLTGISSRQFWQIMAGNDPKHPIVTTDQFGIPKFHFENAGQTGPAEVSLNAYGTPTVKGMDEAMKQNAEQLKEDLNAFHSSFAPEFMREKERSSYFNELLQGAGTFLSESGRSAGSIAMHSIHGVLAQERNLRELQWGALADANKDNPYFQLAGEKVKEWEDAGFDNTAIAFMGFDNLDVPEETKDFLKEYQKLVSSRMADERRMRIAMAYDEDKTNLEEWMSGKSWLKPLGGDENTTINTIAKLSGNVAGSVAVMYLTGRAIGITGASIARAKNLLAGANAAQKAKNAVTLAQAGGADAFLASAATIGERAVFWPSFLSQYDSIRTQSLISGKSLAESNAIGFVAGVAEGAMEYVGFKWFKRFYSDGGWFKNYVLRNIVPEAFQEGTQTTFENAITQLTGVTDKQWSDVMSEIGLSIVAGALGGGMFSFYRAKTLGLEAKVADIAEDLTNKWGDLNQQQRDEVIDVVHSSMEAAEKAGKETSNPEAVLNAEPEKAGEAAAQTAVAPKVQQGATQASAEQVQQQPETAPDYAKSLKTYKDLSAEQKTAAKAYLEAVNQLKEHYTNRVKEMNPNVTDAQLRNGWKHVRAQVLAQKDSNMLVATYEHSINQAVAYLKPDADIVKQNTKEISDKLFAAGYTEEQVKNLTSDDALKRNEEHWKLATDFIVNQGQRMGMNKAEAELLANVVKSLAYDSTLVSPDSDPRLIVEKITNHLTNTQIGVLHGQELPTLFTNILTTIKSELFQNMPIEQKIEVAQRVVSALQSKKKRSADTDNEIASTLFGTNEDAKQKVATLQNSLYAQAELVGSVISHMPLEITDKNAPDQSRLLAMTLLKFMGETWDTIIPAFGIKSTVETAISESFENIAQKYYPKLSKERLGVLENISQNAFSSEEGGSETENENPVYDEKTIEQIQSGTGFYEADSKVAVLTNPKVGTGLHEGTHLSISYLVTDALRLEKVGLLSDTSPVHLILARLRAAAKSEGLELTDQQLQETLNDAVNDFIVNGQTKDPKITGLLNELRAKGIERYKRLLNSKYGQQGGKGGLKAEQKQQVRNLVSGESEADGNFLYKPKAPFGLLTATTPGTMLADAYKLQAEANMEQMPDEFNSSAETGLASWGERLKQFADKYPVAPAPMDNVIDKYVASGDSFALAALAEFFSSKAINIATDAFVEAKTLNDIGNEDLNIPDSQVYFEADAAALPFPVQSPIFKSDFMKDKSIADSLKDVDWSKTGSLISQAAKQFLQSLEGAAGEFDDALAKRGISGAKRGELRATIMRPFYEYGLNLQNWRTTAKPVVDAMGKHFDKLTGAAHAAETLQWYKKFMLPLRQGSKGSYKKAGDFLESKLGSEARKSFDASLEKLKEATQMMIDHGVDAQLFAVEDFFPFAIKDFDKFVKGFLGFSFAFSKDEKERNRFIEEYKKKHPEETQENIERLYVQLIDNQNAMFQRNADSETKVTSFHHRHIAIGKDEDPRIFEYYEAPFDALDNYMEAAYRTVMMRELIGKVTYTEDGKPILMSDPDATGRVGAYLMRVPEGAVPKEIKDNFLEKMRFLASRDAGDRNTLFDIIRQVNQCTTLGSFFNAMNQVMDIPFILTMYGPQAVQDALGDMMGRAGKSLTLEDVGAETANEVFRVQKEDALQKINKAVFKFSGFAWTDKKIKELALNSAAKWAQDVLKIESTGTKNQVLENAQRYAELKYIVNECFPEFDMNMVPPGMSKLDASSENFARNYTRKRLMEALARGGKNEDGTWNNDAKYVYWYLLTKLQPINAASVPANYNKVGAFGKNMYQFSTVATRQMGFLADYWKMKYRTGGSKQAIVGMLKFVAFCMAIGVPKEIIEAVLKGREPNVGGAFVMTPFHVFMINEYSLNLAKKEGIPSATFKTFSGKFALADNVSKDAFTILSGKDFKFNTSKNLPLIGPLMYAWIFGGREQTIRQDRDLFGRKYDPKKARAVREANRQKADSINFLETVF